MPLNNDLKIRLQTFIDQLKQKKPLPEAFLSIDMPRQDFQEASQKYQQIEMALKSEAKTLREILKDLTDLKDPADNQLIISFYQLLIKNLLAETKEDYKQNKVKHRNPAYTGSSTSPGRSNVPQEIDVMAYPFFQICLDSLNTFNQIVNEINFSRFDESAEKKTLQDICMSTEKTLMQYADETNSHFIAGTKTGLCSFISNIDSLDQKDLPEEYTGNRVSIAANAYIPPQDFYAEHKSKDLIAKFLLLEHNLKELKNAFNFAFAKTLALDEFKAYADDIVIKWRLCSRLISDIDWGDAQIQKSMYANFLKIYVFLEDNGWRCEAGHANGLAPDEKSFQLFLLGIKGKSDLAPKKIFNEILKVSRKKIREINEALASQAQADSSASSAAESGSSLVVAMDDEVVCAAAAMPKTKKHARDEEEKTITSISVSLKKEKQSHPKSLHMIFSEMSFDKAHITTEQILALCKLVSEVEKLFIDPLTKKIMQDPVILLETGEVYERKSLEKHLQASRRESHSPYGANIFTCPITQTTLHSSVTQICAVSRIVLSNLGYPLTITTMPNNALPSALERKDMREFFSRLYAFNIDKDIFFNEVALRCPQIDAKFISKQADLIANPEIIRAFYETCEAYDLFQKFHLANYPFPFSMFKINSESILVPNISIQDNVLLTPLTHYIKSILPEPEDESAKSILESLPNSKKYELIARLLSFYKVIRALCYSHTIDVKEKFTPYKDPVRLRDGRVIDRTPLHYINVSSCHKTKELLKVLGHVVVERPSIHLASYINPSNFKNILRLFDTHSIFFMELSRVLNYPVSNDKLLNEGVNDAATIRAIYDVFNSHYGMLNQKQSAIYKRYEFNKIMESCHLGSVQRFQLAAASPSSASAAAAVPASTDLTAEELAGIPPLIPLHSKTQVTTTNFNFPILSSLIGVDSKESKKTTEGSAAAEDPEITMIKALLVEQAHEIDRQINKQSAANHSSADSRVNPVAGSLASSSQTLFAAGQGRANPITQEQINRTTTGPGFLTLLAQQIRMVASDGFMKALTRSKLQ